MFLVYDHVLGRPDTFPGTGQHEPFVLIAAMAAAAPELEFATSVVVLPQRKTALVARQAADLTNLTGGRFRLGAGTGWNRDG